MTEIIHKDSGAVLARVDADTLAGADLGGVALADRADMSGADLTRATLKNPKNGAAGS